MNLPNVSSAFVGWAQPVTLKTVTTETVRFESVKTVTCKPFEAVVQPTKKNTLNADTLDWSRRHLTFHSVTEMLLGQLVEYKGADYKIVEVADWSEYGYYEAIAEQTKNTVEVCTL